MNRFDLDKCREALEVDTSIERLSAHAKIRDMEKSSLIISSDNMCNNITTATTISLSKSLGGRRRN